MTGKTNEQLMFKRLNKWQAGDIERLREALQDISDVSAVDADSESWCNRFYRVKGIAKRALEPVLGRRTHE